MSREIKFRVWDKKTSRFISEGEMFGVSHYYDIHTQRFATWDSYYSGYGDSWVLHQYTGMKDKNGKEIFEGDIIKYNIPWLYNEEVIRQVKWNEDFLHFMLDDKIDISDLFDMVNVEVIGNIYENSELLNETT